MMFDNMQKASGEGRAKPKKKRDAGGGMASKEIMDEYIVTGEEGTLKDSKKKRLFIERIYQKNTQLKHILLRPYTYIGSIETITQANQDGVHIALVPQDTGDTKDTRTTDQKTSLMRRIPRDAEACTVLVGHVEYLDKPAVSFVRLAEKQLHQYEQALRKQKNELKKLQNMNRASEQELSSFEVKYNELQQEALQSADHNRQGLSELSAKEEEVVVIKVELSALQEKYKARCNESEKLLSELDLMRQNYHSASEIKGLRMVLKESRTNGDRLHKESELVVQNVNTWVQEQKAANEKLGNKIREQSKAIMQLTAEKQQMLEQIAKAQKANNKLRIEVDERRSEAERFKALQNHSSHQQVLLNQLRSRLEEHELEGDQEVASKMATIEDLHNCLKLNIENIQQLNTQVLENLTEVPLPVRFVFVLLGPETDAMDYHEVGRSVSTLMSNQHFHEIAYKAETRSEILHAINEFLNESIVLPPGDWDQKTLLPVMDMARKRTKQRRTKMKKQEEFQGEKTYRQIGVTETIIATSFTNILFALFSGQPVILYGATGPVLVFEKHLFSGGRHVDHMSDQIVLKLSDVVNKKNKGGVNIKPFQVAA